MCGRRGEVLEENAADVDEVRAEDRDLAAEQLDGLPGNGATENQP